MNEQACNRWRNAVAIVLSVLALVLFHQLWIPRGFYVEFDYCIDKPLDFQAFYSHRHHTDGAYQYEKCALTEKQGHARVFLPVNHMDKFRLSLGKQPGRVELRNVSLQGRDVLLLDENQPLTPHDMDGFKLQGSVYSVVSGAQKPYLERTNIGNLAAGKFRELNALNLLLLGFCPGFLFITIWNMVKERRTGVVARKCPTLLNIEFLRILFTLGVLHYHFARNMGGVWSGGGQGVEFFFLLSGYLLALSYKPERRLLDVAWRNWCRFVPLVVVGGLLAGGEWKSFEGMFMLQNTGLAYMDVPNGPSWYIAVLFWCTLFYLSLLKVLSEQARPLVVGTLAFVSYLIVARTGDARWNMVLEYVPCGMVRGLAGMGLGIVLAVFCRRLPESQSGAKSWLCTALEAAGLVFVVGCIMEKSWLPEYWIYQPLSHAMLLVLFVLRRGYISTWLERPIWAMLARYCLAIYLTHVCFLQWDHAFLWKIGSPELNMVVAIAWSCALGVAGYYLVEIPCVNWLNRIKINRK